ncbi:collagen alpha-2(I) chain-like [Piliocolobus tephrosceles]|uniref:collagen alpha-2(I) chain-like n=1 Tax=Piliocolobus tephrosceles TaxID=591936 RepID=UPI000C2A8A06|nr:collagen alpha-2(I) chain-like [Piliocolobus tephrosceles]
MGASNEAIPKTVRRDLDQELKRGQTQLSEIGGRPQNGLTKMSAGRKGRLRGSKANQLTSHEDNLGHEKSVSYATENWKTAILPKTDHTAPTGGQDKPPGPGAGAARSTHCLEADATQPSCVGGPGPGGERAQSPDPGGRNRRGAALHAGGRPRSLSGSSCLRRTRAGTARPGRTWPSAQAGRRPSVRPSRCRSDPVRQRARDAGFLFASFLLGSVFQWGAATRPTASSSPTAARVSSEARAGACAGAVPPSPPRRDPRRPQAGRSPAAPPPAFPSPHFPPGAPNPGFWGSTPCAHGAGWECRGRGRGLAGGGRPLSVSFVFVHTPREASWRRERAARGGGASARQRTGARGEGRRRGARGAVGAGPSLPSIVCDWLARGAGAGRRVLGDSLGVSHLSIVFAAAAAPPSLSNASAAFRSPSSSRRRRGVSFPVCPLPRNRAPLVVSPEPGPGLSRRLSPTAATAAAPSLLSLLLPAPLAPLSSVKSRSPPLPRTPDLHQDPRGPLNYRPRAPAPSFRAGKGWKSPPLRTLG